MAREGTENNYTVLYHGRDKVLTADNTLRTVRLSAEHLLPFSLRKGVVDLASFQAWVHERVSILSRTNMPKIYSYRKIGRDRARLILDSSAVTFIDNFWLWESGMTRTWDDILRLRDIDTSLFSVALEGKENPAVRLKNFDDITSIFTVKGAFPKTIYKNKLLKMGFNAEFEIVGAELGNALDISVAQSRESLIYPGAVESDIFTNTDISMAHAGDVIVPKRGKEPRELFYDKLAEWDRPDMLKQFQRILILSYLTSNFDMHHENFGFLYNPKTFDIIGMAPAFDFNDAFHNWGSPAVFHEWEMSRLQEWVHNNEDILDNSANAMAVIKNSKYLSEDQKAGVIDRINYLFPIHI